MQKLVAHNIGYFAFLSSLCSLCLCGSTKAAPDPELKTPYDIRVVLHLAEHRMLTPQFQKLLESQLRDQLQLMLGKLAKVEVVRAHPLLNDIRTKGLQPVLDTWDELSNRQTLFVLIDFVEGQYQIETGHHDGMTGLSGSVVRRETVGDHQRVADTAAQMVRREFGVVGTFEKLQGKEIKMGIKGGGLVESLDPWLHKGDVFAIVRLSTQADKIRASPIEWAVLQVVETLPDGFARCRYFCRYEEDRMLADGGPGAAYRCLQLRTTQAKVRLRLVNDKTQEFLNGLRVQVSADADFQSKPATGTTFNGLFETSLPFNRVAFVRVLAGESVLAAFPVPLVDERTVVCRMAPDIAAEQRGDLERRKGHWIRWLVDALAVADQGLSAVNAALDNLEEALKLGRKHHEAMIAEVSRLENERDALKALAANLKIKLDMNTGVQLSAALAKRQDQLGKYLDEMEKLIKEANSDERREMLATLKRAQILEKQAEFDKAIELYETVLKAGGGGNVKTHLDELKAAWAIKSKEHLQARQFIYATWPTLDLTAVMANMGKATESFQMCKEAGDRLSPLKLLLTNVQHAKELLTQMEALRKARENLDSRAKWKELDQLAKRLESLQIEVQAWVTSGMVEAKQ
jgi:tetratricopeptide (TPR) repeat protein